MTVTKAQIEDAKRRYEKHFNIPFPNEVLFQVGNPQNIDSIDQIFKEDLKAVNEAIGRNEPFDEDILNEIIF